MPYIDNSIFVEYISKKFRFELAKINYDVTKSIYSESILDFLKKLKSDIQYIWEKIKEFCRKIISYVSSLFKSKIPKKYRNMLNDSEFVAKAKETKMLIITDVKVEIDATSMVKAYNKVDITTREGTLYEAIVKYESILNMFKQIGNIEVSMHEYNDLYRNANNQTTNPSLSYEDQKNMSKHVMYIWAF